jgi:hypothetical protein
MANGLKGVAEDCLVFFDLQQKVAVNVIPLDRFHFLPRVGEHLYLPGIEGKGQGQYRVDAIRHTYREEPDSPVERGDVALLNITADVTKTQQPKPTKISQRAIDRASNKGSSAWT